jgi:hypothetical protein
MLKKLIRLADRLDQNQQGKVANEVDHLIKKIAVETEAFPDDKEGYCDFDKDECHFCWAICGTTEWLCGRCKIRARKLNLTDKEYAYSDPGQIEYYLTYPERRFDINKLPEKVIIEDISTNDEEPLDEEDKKKIN